MKNSAITSTKKRSNSSPEAWPRKKLAAQHF